MITLLVEAWPLKPGLATLLFFRVEESKPCGGPCGRCLCIKGAWPRIAYTLYKNHLRSVKTYFMT